MSNVIQQVWGNGYHKGFEKGFLVAIGLATFIGVSYYLKKKGDEKNASIESTI